jgi:hypothetical protein
MQPPEQDQPLVMRCKLYRCNPGWKRLKRLDLTKRLTLYFDEPLSFFAFKINSRR